MAHRGKKYRDSAGKVERRPYPLEEAVGLVQESAYASFDETVEVAMRLGVNPRAVGIGFAESLRTSILGVGVLLFAAVAWYVLHSWWRRLNEGGH